MSQPPRHFLDIWKLEPDALRAIIEDAKRRKAARAGWPMGRPDADAPARDRVLALIFEKNSTRTRFSFDAAIRQLGGQAIISSSFEMQLGRGETIEDTSRVLSRMVDAVMIRANRHEDVEHFAHVASIPVINGLTDKSHPCQVMADVLTFEEHRGPIEGRTIAWVGDGNNVCASFIHAAAAFRFRLNIACPAHFHPDLVDLARANKAGAEIVMSEDPAAAVKGADCVVTDTWVSMGDEDSAERFDIFEPYQVDEDLMRLARPDAVFLHCLPAHRGEEVTDEVIDGAQSLVWHEAENRIHAQKSVLAWCFGAVA
jgi:ornithine carbamoyltransferase